MTSPFSDSDLAALADVARDAAAAAGAAAMAYFRPDARTSAAITAKAGGSPVSEADHAADRALTAHLAGTGFPLVSEEGATDHDLPAEAPFWSLDPIDGTRAFIAGDPHWGVAVALVAAGRPLVGVVYAPAHGRLYEARRGSGAWMNGARLALADAPAAPYGTSGPKTFVAAFAGGDPRFQAVPRIPALALRIAAVASGDVAVALASGGAHAWDLTAADLVLAEAGGVLAGPDGAPLAYDPTTRRFGALVAAPAALFPAMRARLAAAVEAQAAAVP